MKLNNIKMVIMDVDGVLTDGSIVIDDCGAETQVYDVQDGSGIVYLQRAGIKTAIITARKPKVVRHRAKMLGITELHQGILNKIDALSKILRKYKLSLSQICYVGDDLMDIPVLKRVGYAVAVRNARPEVKKHSHFVTKLSGGHGAIRELAEKILKAQRKWKTIILPRYENT
ncbi:MAG: HAD hydrolase family protein [Planctomycetes bacterium]|nr:HAD hydrolase family protein [Planctomycetota bacterium]